MADTDTTTAPPPQQLQPESGPDLTAMIPYQSDPQSVDVNTPNPQQPQLEQPPALTQTIPSETYPNNPDIERQFHESWMRRALDKAGSILGGDQTIHITKDADGNVTMTHDPSTTGEKWGRVAQAALTGAAAGLANSQGPGGLAKAAAAGVQTGMQQPQQREQQAQQQVDFENKQLNAKASRIHLTQQTAMEAAQTSLAQLKLDSDTADVLTKNLQDYQGRPGATDYGSYDPADPHGEINLAKSKPGAMDDFLGKNNRKTAVVLEGDHKLHVIGYNASDEDKWNDKPVAVPYNDMDENGRPKISYKMAGPGTHTQGDLDLTRDAVQTKYLQHLNSWAGSQKDLAAANAPKEPKTYQEAYSQASAATSPKEQARLTSLGDRLYKDAQGLRTINQTNVGYPTAPGATAADMIKPGGGFEPQTVNGINAQKLASGDETLADLPKRMAKGAATPQQMIAAAEQYSQQLYGLGYSPTMIENEKKQFDNMKVQGVLDGIDKMVGTGGQQGYLDTVVDLANKAGVGTNAPWNTIALAVKQKLGDQAAKNFNTALGEVQRSLPSLIGNPLLGGSDSDLKQRMAQGMFGQDVTAGNLQSTAATLNNMLKSSADSLTRNNRFLQRRYGLKGNYTDQYSPTQQGGGGGAAAPQNPQGNTSQAARAPGGPQLPAPLPNVEVRLNKATGQYIQLQGNKWVDVAPPATR